MKKLLKNNQSGFAYLLTVVVLSASVLTSLSLAYVYSMNRLRYQTRIKEAYKLLNVTESAAKTVKAAWDKAVIESPGDSDANYAAAVNTTLAAGVDDGGTCAQACNTAYGINPSDVTMCFDNTDNASIPYCFTGGSVEVSYHLVEPKLKWQKVDKFIAKINKFFNGVHATSMDPMVFTKPTLLSWVFKTSKAMATYNGGEGGGTTCVSPMQMRPVVGLQGVYACQCPEPGQTFNGSTCVSSTTTQSPPQGMNCDDPAYANYCTTTKTISANTQANCNQNPKPSSCARCVSSDGAGGQNSSCGIVSAKIPGSSDEDAPVVQAFRISKSGDMF